MAAKKKKKRSAEEARAARRFTNRQVVMNCAVGGEDEVAAGTVATCDPCDRAHDVRAVCDGPLGHMAYLVSAADMASVNGQAERRRYHRSYMHEVVEGRVVEELGADGVVRARLVEKAVAVVSDETVFDETFEAQRRLAALGLDVFGRGVVADAAREERMAHPRNRDLVGRRRGG